MCIKNLSEKTKVKFHSTTASAVKWTKRIALVGAVAGVIIIGTVYASVKIVTPHVHNIYSIAKLIYGEARGESKRGQKAVFSTILVRKTGDGFPDTTHGVVYQPYSNNAELLQYNAMGDEVHEDLSTELGQTILLRTAWWYTLDQFGLFYAPKEARSAHSYCRPDACERQKGYFGTLKLVGQIGNHVFYGDCDCAGRVELVAENDTTAPKTSLRPKTRPEVTPESQGTSSAPKRSLRPKARPKQSDVLQSSIGQAIDEAMLKE